MNNDQGIDQAPDVEPYVYVVDSGVAKDLSKAIISAVAETIVDLVVDWGGSKSGSIDTLPDLQIGLAVTFSRPGVRPTFRNQKGG